MSNKLILITGATGYVGFATLVAALKAGHNLRVSARRASQLQQLESHPLVKPYISQFEGVLLPELTAPGAFDSALQGVTHVLHIASPIPNPTDDPERDIVRPSVESTKSILQSALKSTTLQRIVITSSVVAILPFDVLIGGNPSKVYDSTSRVHPLPTGPWSHPGKAYVDSKALALDYTERFVAESKPHFSIVNIMPGIVVGPNHLYKNAEQMTAPGSSNVRILNVALGKKSDPFALNVVGVSDVARVHIAALDESVVKGSDSFVLDCHRPSYDEVNDIVGKAFPEAVRDGTFPLGGHQPAAEVRLDTEKTVKTFGPLDSYERDLLDLFAQYIELKNNAQ